MLKKLKKFIDNRDNYKNSYYLRYHLYKFLDRLLANLGLKKISGNNSRDMFNWDKYNLHFRGEMAEASKSYTTKLAKGDYNFSNDQLIKTKADTKDLHPVHELIYETILQLNPKSVFELGCGHGMHLYNLQIFKPELHLAGADRSEKQIEFLKETFPELQADIQIKDATTPFDALMYSKYDLSFTNAVIMHIHFEDTHKTALANLFNVSKKYVIMHERWRNHDILNDIKDLQANKLINWETINFYYKRFKDTDMYIMICSKEPLSNPILENYDLLPQK